jgi:hypothetical protein
VETALCPRRKETKGFVAVNGEEKSDFAVEKPLRNSIMKPAYMLGNIMPPQDLCRVAV